MSCHNIGRGMDSVVVQVIKLLEENEISKEAARKIIIACRNGVYWCDGNEYEAVESINRCYCGNCMNRIESGKPLYYIYDTSFDVVNRDDISNNYNLITDSLCEDCFTQIINKHCNDESAAEREINFIKENCREYEYLSEG